MNIGIESAASVRATTFTWRGSAVTFYHTNELVCNTFSTCDIALHLQNERKKKKGGKMIDDRNVVRYISHCEFNRWYYLHCTELLVRWHIGSPSNNGDNACKFIANKKKVNKK